MGNKGEGSGSKGGGEVGNAYPPVHPLHIGSKLGPRFR